MRRWRLVRLPSRAERLERKMSNIAAELAMGLADEGPVERRRVAEAVRSLRETK